MKNLQLSLKSKWFEMTDTPEGKSEDYREINAYWFKRLVFNSLKVSQYYNINPNIDLEVQLLCKDSFWSKTIAFNPFDCNIMTLGYPKATDKERIKIFEHLGIEIRTGNPLWGAEEGKLYFVIKHGKRIQ